MTPTETRELLELAAKTLGRKVVFFQHNRGAGWVSLDDGTDLNPFDSYGDRYRLARAVKGNLYFSGTRGCFEILSDSDEPPIIEHFTPGNET